jgi:hypothetical protein
MRAMLGTAARAAARVSRARTAVAARDARSFSDAAAPSDAARASRQLEAAERQAHAHALMSMTNAHVGVLSEMKAAQADALAEMQHAQAMALEDMKGAQALALQQLEHERHVREAALDTTHEMAQKLKLAGIAILVFAPGAYLVSSMLHDVTASLRIAEARADDASHDVRALMTRLKRGAWCGRR